MRLMVECDGIPADVYGVEILAAFSDQPRKLKVFAQDDRRKRQLIGIRHWRIRVVDPESWAIPDNELEQPIFVVLFDETVEADVRVGLG